MPTQCFGLQKEAKVERQVQDLLKRSLIELASNTWSSQVDLVKNKDGKLRFCVDYRQHTMMQQNAYSPTRIDENLDALVGNNCFSILDLISKYWQAPLDQDAQKKLDFDMRSNLQGTAFWAYSTPATLQWLMERVLDGLH